MSSNDGSAHHIGARLFGRRMEIGISQEDLAQRIGIDVSELQDVEAGRCRLSPEAIIAASPVLNVTPSWFFDGLPD